MKCSTRNITEVASRFQLTLNEALKNHGVKTGLNDRLQGHL